MNILPIMAVLPPSSATTLACSILAVPIVSSTVIDCITIAGYLCILHNVSITKDIASSSLIKSNVLTSNASIVNKWNKGFNIFGFLEWNQQLLLCFCHLYIHHLLQRQYPSVSLH